VEISIDCRELETSTKS